MRIGITMGDPSGIGPEIIAKALPVIAPFGQLVVIGDAWVFGRACARTRVPRGVSYDFVEMANVPRKGFAFGRIKAEYGKASLEFIDQAVALLDRGLIDCLVTCPVSKEAVSLGAGPFSGHTEYLARKAGVRSTVMMLLNERLRFGLVTTHLPLREVPAAITREKVRETVSMTAQALRRWFGIRSPSLAVCGVNPHASDNGVIGDEERKVVIPALAGMSKKNFRVAGPLSADCCCAAALAGKFDAVIAMYHDQALIPLKTIGAYSGVNLTAGLPYVRTSPLHGTAFDIAGKGRANAGSLIAAVETACRCARRPRKA